MSKSARITVVFEIDDVKHDEGLMIAEQVQGAIDQAKPVTDYMWWLGTYNRSHVTSVEITETYDFN